MLQRAGDRTIEARCFVTAAPRGHVPSRAHSKIDAETTRLGCKWNIKINNIRCSSSHECGVTYRYLGYGKLKITAVA